MGIIQRQSIKSSVIITAGFFLGAFNIMVIAPKILSADELGLTRIVTDVGLTLATFCTLGCVSIIYKFFPFYKNYLPAKKNDLPFITLMVCIAGLLLSLGIGYLLRNVVIRKYSSKSPLFVEYSYLVYPFCFFLLMYMWLESFAWSYQKTVLSNTLKEVLPRVLFSLLLVLIAMGLINLPVFMVVFSLSYLLPSVILFWLLRKNDGFQLTPHISPVTRRLKFRMANFGIYMFGAQFLNLLSKTSDTFIISAKADRGLTDAAVFTLATYIVTLMEIPQRSINAISIPIISESWMKKDMKNIQHIYNRSVSNMLTVGLLMFALLFLNAGNMAAYLGKDYHGIEQVVFLMGLAKLIDLGTGANGIIIGTSSFWRVELTSNVIYTVLALPLNYILISYFGLLGAAYANLGSQVIYNIIRYAFLWYKFGLQPYTFKHLAIILITASVVTPLFIYMPEFDSVVVDAVVNTALFCMAFVPLAYILKISEEMNKMINKQLLKIKQLFVK